MTTTIAEEITILSHTSNDNENESDENNNNNNNNNINNNENNNNNNISENNDILIQKEKEKEKERERQREKQKEIEKERERQREKEKEKEKENIDNLIKLYNSGSFDSWAAVNHMFQHQYCAGVVDYLCNQLYTVEDKDIDFFITQLCIILINQPHEQKVSLSSLARFVMDRCAKSMRFAIKAYWIFQAFEEDGQKNLLTIEDNAYLQHSNHHSANGTGLESNISPSSSPSSKNKYIQQAAPTAASSSTHTSPSNSPTKQPLNLANNNSTQENESNNNNVDKLANETTKIYINNNEVKYEDLNKPTVNNYRLVEMKKELATRLREYCEMSVITCSRPLITRPRTSSLPSPMSSFSSSLPTETTIPLPNISEEQTEQQKTNKIIETIAEQEILTHQIEKSKTPPIELQLTEYDIELQISKSFRCEYLNSILSFIQNLSNISKKLISVPIDLRQAKLKDEISGLNLKLPLGLYIPMWQSSEHHCIVRIPPEEVKILNSRERVPFLLVLEIIDGQEEASAANLLKIVSSYLPITLSNNKNSSSLKLDLIKKHIVGTPPGDSSPQSSSSPAPQLNGSPVISLNSTTAPSTTTTTTTTTTSAPVPIPVATLSRSHSAPTTPTTAAPIFTNDKLTSSPLSSPVVEKLLHENNKFSHFGELWEDKTERYRKISPYGHLPNWRLASVIIKTGDDCRQEQMAVQLIRKFQEIWNSAKLPLFLKPYSILVTSSSSGIIETIPDTISLHNLKKNLNQISLLNYFKNTYGNEQSEAFRIAQAKFVESMAAYSIVTYLLQVKDRHNGNIMIDKEGHIIHIDFGFILSNSPGNMSFESAPFKLTQEQLDVMGGTTQSPQFHYYQALCVRGFLEARKHYEKFVSFIELMMTGPKMSCFQSGKDCIEQIKQRFLLNLSERECGYHVEQLITNSLNHRTTRYYDYYQFYYNSIYS